MPKVTVQGKTFECPQGEISEPEWRERTRRSLPPPSLTQSRRLACQTQVLGFGSLSNFDFANSIIPN